MFISQFLRKVEVIWKIYLKMELILKRNLGGFEKNEHELLS